MLNIDSTYLDTLKWNLKKNLKKIGEKRWLTFPNMDTGITLFLKKTKRGKKEKSPSIVIAKET